MGAALPAAYFWHTEAPCRVSRLSESGIRSWPAPPPKAIAHPFLWPFSAGRTWRPGLRVVIFGRGLPAAYFWHTEAPCKVSRHSESGGRSWPAPPPKAIAHPILWPFSAGRTWHPGLRAFIFGRGCVRGLFLAHAGASHSLAPFRVQRSKLGSPPPKAIAHPFL